MHVNDVVDGFIAAATRPDVCGSIFHLVDSTPVTQRDYIASAGSGERAVRVHYIPRPALLGAGAALDMLGRC